MLTSDSSQFGLFGCERLFGAVFGKHGYYGGNPHYLYGYLSKARQSQVFIRVANHYSANREVTVLKHLASVDEELVWNGAIPSLLKHFRVPNSEYSCVVTPYLEHGRTLKACKLRRSDIEAVRDALVMIIGNHRAST